MLQRAPERCRFRRLAALASVIALLGTIAAPAAAAGPTHIPTPIADPQGTLRTDGTYAVWTRLDEVSHVTSIGAVDLRDGRLIPVAGGLSQFTPPAELADGTVVWYDQPTDASRAAHIRAMALATGQAIDVSLPGSPLRSLGQPAIGDGWVVWAEWPSPDAAQRLMGRDIRSLTPPVPLVADFVGQAPQMSGQRVVWTEGNAGGGRPTPWQVRSLVIGRGPPVTVATITSTILPLLATSGEIVTTRAHGYEGSEIVTIVEAIDLRTGARTELGRTRPLPRPLLSTDGRLVVWNELGDLNDAVIVARMADLATTSHFVPTAPAETLAGGVAVWYEVGPPRPGVIPGLYVAPVAMLLPSAGRPAPAETGPHLTFFSETGHTLVYGFKAFWERSGGLPVFGFPLTEEFSQRNADTGQMHTVQYLERQRFEYHPDLASTPYEVQLGRLGAEEATRRAELRGLWAFDPVPANADHPAGCRHLAATQHRVCGEFRPYWEGHGLELGDAGISFRESLALFGYPISEEFIDPTTGLVTQYFERARFDL